MGTIEQDFIDWLTKIQKKEVASFETAFHKEFGKLRLKDGREAEIQVTIEADSDDWKNDY